MNSGRAYIDYYENGTESIPKDLGNWSEPKDEDMIFLPAPYSAAEDNHMGEIRVKVKLVNAADEENARTGRIPRDQVRSVLAEALVDTGAIRTIIPAHIQEQLGLSL